MEFINEVVNHFATLNWFEPTWDVFVAVFFLLASLVYGVSLGRDRIVVVLVSIYMALAVVNYAPYIQEFTTNISVNGFAFKVSVFIGVFLLLFFFLSHSALMKTLASQAEQGKLWQVMALSILQTGLLISVTLSFFPDGSTEWLSEVTRDLFVSEQAKAVWITAPLVLMGILGREKDK